MSGIVQTNFSVRNYLVPASGQTHCAEFSGTLSAQPYLIDWQQFKIDNFAFIPQGVFIDNTQGTAPVVITILPLNYNVVCPAGQSSQAQFPAPLNQTMQITGAGFAAIFFVDFPVLPSGQNVSIAGTPSVNISGATNAASPVYTLPPPNSQGLPYQVQKTPFPLTSVYISTTGAATNHATTAGQYLRKFVLTVSGDAALAAAARNLITVLLDGVAIFKTSPLIPAAAGASGVLAQYVVSFDDAAQASAGGNLTVQAGSVLTTGLIELNAYFD